MQIEAILLSVPWRVGTSLAALPTLGYALATAPWRAWLGRQDRQHVWLGTIVLLVLLWSMRAGITPGLSFQFLLAATLTLMHGWRLALVGFGAVLAAQCVLEGGFAPWTAWGANFICYAIVPTATIAALHALVERRLPHNYFIFFFITVFAGSMLAFNLAGLARVALLSAAGTLAWEQLGGEYFVYLPMVSFGEAFMNGIVMAGAVVLRPEWVATFDERLYFTRR